MGLSAAQLMSRYMQIHISVQKLSENSSNTILKIHVLTGYDATSKVGTKVAAVKCNFHLLASFWQNKRPNFLALKQAEWTYS